MIPTPKELLTTWYMEWKNDLEVNRAKQSELQEDEARIVAIVEACEQAFAVLFPEPEPEPEPTENGTE
jgi:aminoglycoside/choline kinase family phosphotransferase